MQAVILAAGKGIRMGELTHDTPKPLLKYQGKTLLEWKLDALPENVTEIILVVGYLKDKIISTIGESYRGKKIRYVIDQEIAGTGKALWQTQQYVHDNFIVMMGDDIYTQDALSEASEAPWSITVQHVPRENNASRIIKDEHDHLVNFVTADTYRSQFEDDGYAFTGLYNLSTKIFTYPLVKLKTRNEWGLPQTLLSATNDFDINILETKGWQQITSSEDLEM